MLIILLMVLGVFFLADATRAYDEYLRCVDYWEMVRAHVEGRFGVTRTVYAHADWLLDKVIFEVRLSLVSFAMAGITAVIVNWVKTRNPKMNHVD